MRVVPTLGTFSPDVSAKWMSSGGSAWGREVNGHRREPCLRKKIDRYVADRAKDMRGESKRLSQWPVTVLKIPNRVFSSTTTMCLDCQEETPMREWTLGAYAGVGHASGGSNAR